MRMASMYQQRLKVGTGAPLCLTFFWGIGNKTYLPLLCLIPIFNLVWFFVCGFKGNEWAWQKGDYQDIATFKAVQATWNRAGLVQFIITMAVMVLYFLFIGTIITSILNSTHG